MSAWEKLKASAQTSPANMHDRVVSRAALEGFGRCAWDEPGRGACFVATQGHALDCVLAEWHCDDGEASPRREVRVGLYGIVCVVELVIPNLEEARHWHFAPLDADGPGYLYEPDAMLLQRFIGTVESYRTDRALAAQLEG